jgi:hypothetical protein
VLRNEMDRIRFTLLRFDSFLCSVVPMISVVKKFPLAPLQQTISSDLLCAVMLYV